MPTKPTVTMKAAPLRIATAVLAFFCGILPCGRAQSSFESFGPISVPGTSVIFDPDGVLTAASLAGLIGGNGNNSPLAAVQALTFPSGPGQFFTFSASGTATFNYHTAADTVGPDGAAISFAIASLGSISGFNAPVYFPLVGVFTDGSPSGEAPADYDYSGGVGQATFAPVLNQVFFIGDGLTGTGSGSLQKFYVPAAATQLWLGFADSHSGGRPFAYGDDAGALSVSGTLNPVQSSPPSIGAGGVVSASAFGEFTSVSPGSWIEIYGSNLAIDSRSWAASDFTGVDAPTSLDGTSVTIGGQAAFIDFISLGQVNALVPSNVATGTQPMTVTVGGVTSAASSINVNLVEPGLDAPPSFKIGGVQYAVALFADGAYVLPDGAIAGLNSRPAQPGDEIVLYGIGFGAVMPNIPAGQLVQQANTLAAAFSISIGGVPVASVPYAGLAPNFTGLYQFNVVVPANAGSGAVPLTFSVGDTAGTQTLYLAVGN